MGKLHEAQFLGYWDWELRKSKKAEPSSKEEQKQRRAEVSSSADQSAAWSSTITLCRSCHSRSLQHSAFNSATRSSRDHVDWHIIAFYTDNLVWDVPRTGRNINRIGQCCLYWLTMDPDSRSSNTSNFLSDPSPIKPLSLMLLWFDWSNPGLWRSCNLFLHYFTCQTRVA